MNALSTSFLREEDSAVAERRAQGKDGFRGKKSLGRISFYFIKVKPVEFKVPCYALPRTCTHGARGASLSCILIVFTVYE